MLRVGYRYAVVAMLALLMAGCDAPDTPEEVTQAFWLAVSEDDANAVAEFSTLAGVADYTGMPGDGIGTEPTLGRIVIEADTATVETRWPETDAGSGPVRIRTHLVRRDGAWLVDHDRTREALAAPDPLGTFLDRMNELGDTLSEQFEQSSGELTRQLEDWSRTAERWSAETARQAREAMESYARTLREHIRDLKASIDRALENSDEAPAEERETLQAVSLELEQTREALEEPTMETLARASATLAETRRRLSSLSDTAFQRYQSQWEATLEAIDERTGAFFTELRRRLE